MNLKKITILCCCGVIVKIIGVSKKQKNYPDEFGYTIPKHHRLAWSKSKHNKKPSQITNKEQDLHSVPCYSILKRCMYKYFSSTTLHGFRYIEPNTPLIDKIVIGAVILLTIVDATIVMKAQLENFFNSTILMTMENKPTSITDIPFPAITICPLSQIREALFNYSDLIKKSKNQLTVKEKTELDYANYLCEFIEEKGFFSSLDSEYLQSIFKKQHKFCKNDIEKLHWLGKPLDPPCHYMQPVLTHNGICYSFNMLPMNQLISRDFTSNSNYAFNDSEYTLGNLSNTWIPDSGYKVQDYMLSSLPWRVHGVQRPNTAIFLLNFNSTDFDDVCTAGSKGFKVYIHFPFELPSKSTPNTYIDDGETIVIKILPRIMKTTSNLRAWPPKERHCYYGHERNLYFYNFYTQGNCDNECEANATLAICGCVAFYHPREELTPICGTDLESCIFNTSVESLSSKTSTGSLCNCLPACSEIEYGFNKISLGHKLKQNKSRSVQSRIEIMFLKRRVTAFLQTTLFGASEVIANFGGVMSLSLGFSIVSLLEIIYFMTLRLITILWNYRRDQLP